ncbi:MAG: type IX secretion system sortase PorU [Bacteroidales bacterium]|nr:type IX secretion system sortase PorU [Bacteroidales bacterium]
MTKRLHISLRNRSTRCRTIACLMALCVALASWAFDPSTYTGSSVLSSGTWVKIGVSESGVYMIPASTLRDWGFDPARVRIHGYGGNRIGDVLDRDTYIDDLPVVPSETVQEGIVFYAVGPDSWDNLYGGYHRETNPYTNVGYYFVTQADSVAPTPAVTATPGASSPTRTGKGRSQHETDLRQATEYGPLMVGEDMRFTPQRTINIPTVGRKGSTVELVCQFVSTISAGSGSLALTVDGSQTPATLRLDATPSSGYAHATLALLNKSVTAAADADNVRIDLKFTSQGTVSAANLDYIALQYDVALEMGGRPTFAFRSDRACSLGGVNDRTRVWDVTDHANVSAVDFQIKDGRAEWTPARSGNREYVAWSSGSKLPAPAYYGRVANQDLHADNTTPDMVIIITQPLARQARRIADLHQREDSMVVSIVDASQIYNEFSSGVPDVAGLRKYLKMVYDRGIAADRPLRYVLLLGRATLDHRGVVDDPVTSKHAKMPCWVVRVPRQSMSETDGYGTDDYIAMLGDGSGSDMGLDELSVAVGRIPMTSDDDGAVVVDKLYRYVESSKKTGWKNKLLMLADDGDNGIHLRQTETVVGNMVASDRQQHVIKKVYMDAYNMSGGVYPLARRDMFRALDEGVVWWYFVGHANDHSWTAEGQLTYTDINSMYLRHIPFVVASTCNFLRWDSQVTSGGEIMYKESYGGAIGMISATRPVYITDNGYFLAALGRSTLSRDNDGRLLTAGEVYRRAKNDILDNKGQRRSNPNRLRFVFMGDPAMRPVTPSNIVELMTIDGRRVNADDQLTIAALANVTVTGRIVAPDGTLMSDFDGVVNVELYDAEQSKTTLGNGSEGSIETFEIDGDKLFMGSAPVKGGEFKLTFSMPEMIADNFRPAAMSMYAYATNSNAEAVGTNRDFYVYGLYEPEKPDTVSPDIDLMVLNHHGFVQGDIVHSSPMVIAHVSDDMGINLSNNGIGRQMTLTLDDFETFNDVSLFYTPDPDGSPAGTINYPLESLGEGDHTLRLRVFDTTGNSCTAKIDFTVAEGLAPSIFDVYSDTNPASTAANFYVRHDHPESVTTVFVTVYDLLGRPIWTGSTKGMSDMDLSTPVTWDLTDRAGHRVKRGIYLYRASITADGTTYETTSRRIAVTAP